MIILMNQAQHLVKRKDFKTHLTGLLDFLPPSNSTPT
jgi:hypothetical protein